MRHQIKFIDVGPHHIVYVSRIYGVYRADWTLFVAYDRTWMYGNTHWQTSLYHELSSCQYVYMSLKNLRYSFSFHVFFPKKEKLFIKKYIIEINLNYKRLPWFLRINTSSSHFSGTPEGKDKY